MHFLPRAPGDFPALTADELNAMLAVAKDRRRGQVRATPTGPGDDPARGWPPACLVDVENTTGSTLPAMAILTPAGAARDPAASDAVADDAALLPILSVSAPLTDADPVLVTLDSIEDGKLGRAAVSGATVAMVAVTDATHHYARPVVGNVFQLASAESGPVRLLTPNGVGTYRTYVLIQGAVLPSEITATGNNGGGVTFPTYPTPGAFGVVATAAEPGTYLAMGYVNAPIGGQVSLQLELRQFAGGAGSGSIIGGPPTYNFAAPDGPYLNVCVVGLCTLDATDTVGFWGYQYGPGALTGIANTSITLVKLAGAASGAAGGFTGTVP